MIASGKNVAEQGQILDLIHRPLFVRKFEKVEVGVRDHDVFCLAADPSAHINVAIGGSGTGLVDVQTNARMAFHAIAAAPARDVERDGNYVPLLDEKHIATGLDHLAGDFMSENQPRRRRRATAHHMLIGPAYVRRNDLEDDPVINPFAIGGINHFGKVDGLYFDYTLLDISHSAIGSHHILLLFSVASRFILSLENSWFVRRTISRVPFDQR